MARLIIPNADFSANCIGGVSVVSVDYTTLKTYDRQSDVAVNQIASLTSGNGASYLSFAEGTLNEGIDKIATSDYLDVEGFETFKYTGHIHVSTYRIGYGCVCFYNSNKQYLGGYGTEGNRNDIEQALINVGKIHNMITETTNVVEGVIPENAKYAMVGVYLDDNTPIEEFKFTVKKVVVNE